MEANWSIDQVKLQIKYAVSELKNYDISLSFNNIVLSPDSKLLRDFNITQGSVLIIETKKSAESNEDMHQNESDNKNRSS